MREGGILRERLRKKERFRVLCGDKVVIRQGSPLVRAQRGDSHLG